jgi:peptidoglycan/LPS O-acetylase OafA/YrhL
MADEEAGTPGFRYRPDIDGLRAIAVLSVIGFHATPKLIPGGFVGVNVFFVISGFLISSLILADVNAGRFSYLKFYERRIRRLFPALIVVLLATWALGLATLLPVELTALGKHIVAAAAFAANILNYFEAGYFDAPAIAKPLLHIWSLGVEEQFYFVFPALLIALLRFPNARLWLAMVGLASFALNIALIRDHGSFTFYLPLTRFWEFIAGVMLAHGFADRGTLAQSLSAARPAREAFSAAGLILILAAVAVTEPDKFPGWMALLPVLGTALVIGAGPQAFLNRALANPRLVFVGLISYPLYLWHWPLIVTGRTIMRGLPNQHERTTAIIAVVIAFVLAYLTYRFVERPIRARSATRPLRNVAVKLASGLAAVALLGLVTVQTHGFLFVYPPAAQALLAPLPLTWITLEGQGTGAGPLLVTYGDSHAGHLHPGLVRLRGERPFRLGAMNWGRCAPIGDPKPDDKDKCDSLTEANRQYLQREKPDIVVIAGFWIYYRDIGRLADTIRSLRQSGVRRVVVIGSVPFWPRTLQELMYEVYRADPQRRLPERLSGFDPETMRVDQQVKAIALAAGATYISAFDELCDARGCLTRIGDTAADIMQTDRTHFGAAGSWFFVSRIAPRIFD